MPVSWNDSALSRRVREAAMRGVVIATEMVASEAVRLILSPNKSGRMYRRRGVEHQASAPGEAPASDTGRLVNSIRTEYDDLQLSGQVLASTAYAEALERGTERMEPRPFLRPALANKQADIARVIAAEIRKAMS